MNIFEYILPPVIGAVIGYLTNSLAIKMLFKPYREWKIFGLRVPFTPGILPKHRKELADNIGKMVGTILLNEQTLQEQLVSEHSHQVLDKVINKNIDELMDYDCPSIYFMIPSALQDSFHSYYASAKEKLKELSINYIQSNEFSDVVHLFVESKLESISKKTLGEIVSTETIEAFFQNSLAKALTFFTEQDFFKEWVSNKLDELKISKHKPNEYIPEEAVNFFVKWFKGELPVLIDHLEEAVFNAELDHKLYLKLRDMIFTYLENLNKVQRFVVNVWGIEERVEEDLPQIIQHTISQIFKNLKNDNSLVQITNALLKSINQLMDKEIKEILSNIDESDYDKLKENVISKIQQYVGDDDQYKRRADQFIQFYDSVKDTEVNKIFDAFNVTTGSASEYISKSIVNALQKQNVYEPIINYLEEKLDNFIYNYPVGKLSALFSIQKEQMEKLSMFFSEKILLILQKDISYVVKAINVQQVVIEKINMFPLEKVENIILKIVKKHLRWINIFGAILGALIGSLQVILNKLGVI